MKLTHSTADIYHNDVLLKKGWVNISDGYLYIWRENNRAYWLLKNIDPSERPTITFNDETRTLRLGRNKIVIHGGSDYQKAKAMLEPWVRK